MCFRVFTPTSFIAFLAGYLNGKGDLPNSRAAPQLIMASQQSSNGGGGGGGGAPRPLQMGAKGAYIVRLLMVGDSSCGKTSLVLRFDQNVFSTKFVTTIGVDYRDKMVKVSLRLCIFVMNESTVYVVCVGPSRFGVKYVVVVSERGTNLPKRPSLRYRNK